MQLKMKNRRALFYIVPVLAVLVMVASFYRNSLSVADTYFFEHFQRDSEMLILGRLTADDRRLEIPGGAKLALATINGFRYDAKRYNHGFHVLKEGRLPDKPITSIDVTDETWQGGVNRLYAGILVKSDLDIPRYVGRKLYAGNNGTRVVEGIEGVGEHMVLRVSGPALNAQDLADGQMVISGEPIANSSIKMLPYTAQYGLQGDIYSAIYRITGFRLNALYLLNCSLLAIAVVLLSVAYGNIVSRGFGACMYFSVLLSPWMTVIARNLYWVPVIWLVPALAAIGVYYSRSRTMTVSCFLVMYLGFFMKALMGYEYLSSIILFAATIFALCFIAGDPRFSRAKLAAQWLLTCLLGSLGFLSALLIHAGRRGDSILDGLRNIYINDIQRRTYGDPTRYSGALADSLSASPLEAVLPYINDWKTDLLLGVHGKYFVWLTVFCILVVAYRYFSKHRLFPRDAALLLVFLLVPISWYVLAKAHSVVHVHISFVLWYLGYVAVLLYLTITGLRYLFISAVKVSAETDLRRI